MEQGQFIAILSNHIKHRFETISWMSDWKRLKDHLRGVVHEQPGWTQIQMIGEEVRAYCQLRTESDAVAVYKQLKHNVKIRIFRCGQYYETWRSNEQTMGPFADFAPQSITCNYLSSHPFAPRGTPFVNHSSPVPQDISYAPDTSYTLKGVPYNANFSSPALAPQTHNANLQEAVYYYNNWGIPVQCDAGAKKTEDCGIFISNLKYDTTEGDLWCLLWGSGLRPLAITLHRSKGGSPKGVATAHFNTQDEADNAVCILDGIEHLERKILVRKDKNVTVVGIVSPPIAVGSKTG